MISWFKCHTNWMLVISYSILSAIVGIISWYLPLPYNILYTLLLFGIGIWVLRQKGRSMKHLSWLVLIIIGLSQIPSGGFPEMSMSFFIGRAWGQWLLPIIIWLCLSNKRGQSIEPVLSNQQQAGDF